MPIKNLWKLFLLRILQNWEKQTKYPKPISPLAQDCIGGLHLKPTCLDVRLLTWTPGLLRIATAMTVGATLKPQIVPVPVVAVVAALLKPYKIKAQVSGQILRSLNELTSNLPEYPL